MNNTSTITITKKLTPILALVLLLITACSKKDNQTGGTAYLQVTNASQTDSPMDFYVGDTKKNSSSLAYNQSTGYFSVSAQQQSAAFKTTATGALVTGFQLTPVKGTYNSIFYLGGGNTAAYPSDDLSTVADKARVRFINLNLQLVSVVDFGITGGAKLATSLGAAQASSYYSVAAGSSFSVYTGGTTTSLLDIPTTIEAGHVYTVYLSGSTQADLKGTVLLQK